MPRSIFPDIPASRRAATITPNYADTGHSSPAPPPLNTRRHTTQFLPTRREARPLRSSPLAGPSLALTQDGNLAVSETEKKLAASREAFAGDVTAESSATEVTSPTSECSSSGHALSAPEPHTRTEPAPDGSMTSRIRRLSLGFKRKSFQVPPAQSDSTPQPRRASSSSSHSHSQEDAPPVPQLPQWARGAVKRSVTEPSTPTDKQTHRQSHHPRPSTSPTMPTSDPVKVARRTSLLPSQLPNTSRDPQENWMTSASAPRFSRLSLKADGVVMPVSVKEARRRSTASLSSRMSASDVRGLKGKQSTRSLRSVHPASETAKRLAEDAEMQPPRPLFRGDSNASSSSLGSSTTVVSTAFSETPLTSRASTSAIVVSSISVKDRGDSTCSICS